MNRKASNTRMPSAKQPSVSWMWWSLLAANAVWAIAAASISSRLQFVMGYGTIPSGPPHLELFLASNSALLFAGSCSAIWIGIAVFRMRLEPKRAGELRWPAATLLIAAVPLLFSVARTLGVPLAPNYWEPLWLSYWTGISFFGLTTQLPRVAYRLSASAGATILCVFALGLANWWFYQSCEYYSNFQLGFNDFGHFAQRIANTASGRGILLETPVLPMFWDHFNPGLLLLVPLWRTIPSVYLFFAIQALALVSGSLVVRGIARRLEYSEPTAVLFGGAWLVQPSLGQMNLAYTYGWHPISLAIPLMLAAIWALLAKRPRWAIVAISLAQSMEEGVIVVFCLFCFGCLVQSRFLNVAQPLVLGLSSRVWGIAGCLGMLTFIAVYRFSGIAEFQTGRFVALGNGPMEVILSPLLRPDAFWGQIFRWEKLAFCLSILLPCFLTSLVRGWRWLLPAALPLMVLIVWDHKPATSLALQYPSALLPVFWCAALIGAQRYALQSATGAFATGLVLSLFVGQLPYSNPSSLFDVLGQTYAESELRRGANDDDGLWLSEQVAGLKQDGSEILATGRIAAHLVGARDVETVGQYVQRREKLAALEDRLGKPIEHYRWILLDRRESFQQTPQETSIVEKEAVQAGFHLINEKYDIVLYSSTRSP